MAKENAKLQKAASTPKTPAKVVAKKAPAKAKADVTVVSTPKKSAKK